MPSPLRKAAVKIVKPLVSDQVWRRLRAPFDSRPATSAPLTLDERLSRMNLTQLAKEFKTDKWGRHYYTPHYERHLGHLKNEQFTLLEIGIGGYARERQGGASLRMWSRFFPHAQVFGLDIEDKSFVDQDRIRTYRGSQADPALLQRIASDAERLEVVIDDGSHRPEHIRATFTVLFPLLNDGGIYVIEDTQTSYWPEFGGSENRHDQTTTMALAKDLLDGLNYEEYVDESYQPTYFDLNVRAVHAYHNLVVIEKGSNAEGTNRRSVLKARYASSPQATECVASTAAPPGTARRRAGIQA